VPGREAQPREEAGRWLAAGALAVLLAHALLALRAARHGWFAYDDFIFLSRVQAVPPSTWLDPRAALAARFWPFYRPLGMESYYWLGLRLFGFEPLGFHALALAVDASGALLVLRIARQLGCGVGPAAVAAVLSLARAPRAHALFEAYSFHFGAGLFFQVLAVTLFLDHLRTRRVAPVVASALALLAGLLCNEVAATASVACALLALRHEGAGTAGGWLRSLARLAPQLAVLAPWLALRVAFLDVRPPPAAYAPSFGPHIAANLLRYAAYTTAPGPLARGAIPLPLLPLGAAALVLAALLGIGLASAAGRRRAQRWLLPVGLVLAGWAAAAIAPFLPLALQHARYAAPLAPPLALAFGASLDLAWRACGARARWGLAAATTACLALSLPWGTLGARALAPEGAQAERLFEIVREELASHPEGARLVLLHGGPQLADSHTLRRFLDLIYGGRMFLRATFPGSDLKLRLVDAARPRLRAEHRHHCVWLALDREGLIARAGPALVQHVLPAGLAARCQGVDSGDRSGSAPRVP
jgi:hypothetical protein